MGVRRTLARLAGLSAVPVLVLTACGGGTSSSIADPPISSAPPPSHPTAKPHHESPEHFIRRWVEIEKRMENTGDTTSYLATSHGCRACTKLANEITAFYKAGGYVKWDGWRILSIEVNGRSSGGPITFAVRNRSMPTTYKESSSGPIKHLAGGVTTELLTLTRASGSWNVQSKAELAS